MTDQPSKTVNLVEHLRLISTKPSRHGYDMGTYWNACEDAADEIERLHAYIEGMAGGAESGASHAWFKSMAKSALDGEAIMVGEMGNLRRLGLTSQGRPESIMPSNSKQELSRCMRRIADQIRNTVGNETSDEDAMALRDGSELIRVLARFIAGVEGQYEATEIPNSIFYQAFGSVGDWGYDRPMGESLKNIYTECLDL